MVDKPTFGPLLAEGKTKMIYAYPGNENLAYMVSKDQITAFDGARRNEIAGKSGWSTITTANVFRLLNDEEFATHFVQHLNALTLPVLRFLTFPFYQDIS